MGAKNLKRPKETATGRASASRSSGIHRDRLVAGVICVFLAALVWIAFARALGNGFVSYDDGDYVYNNPHVTAGLTPDGIRWAFTHVHAANWHPLTTLSHMLDCQLYGVQPWGHHLTNILLHTAAAVLLFLALLKLTVRDASSIPYSQRRRAKGKASVSPAVIDRRYSIWPSAFVAAVFAIHPLRVESVAWVSERKDVLSGVFFMLTLLAYARYARSDRPSPGRYLTVVALFALGLLCKPTLVTLPFVLLLLDYWPLARCQKTEDRGQKSWVVRGPWSVVHDRWSVVRDLIVEKLPFFVLSAASCLVTILAQKKALDATLKLTFGQRVGNAVVSYVTYLGQTFYPAKLAVLYPYSEGNMKIDGFVLSFVLLLAISVIFFVLRKRYPFLLMGWLWYLGMLVPMIGLVQVGLQTRADRYTYLAQIGLYISATWGVKELFAKWPFGRKLLTVAALVTVTALAVCAYHETSFWQNSETLWTHAIDDTSNNDIAHYNLGSVLLRKRKPGAAIVEFQKALQINPDYGDADVDTGSALMLMGQTNQAISYFKRAVQIKPDLAEAWSNLGSALLEKGQVDEAVESYQKAVAIKPGSADMHYNLGRALVRKANWDGAVACYQAALEIQPNEAKIHNGLGVALAEAGKTDEALRHFRAAVSINPSYSEAHYNLGCVLAHLGQREEAAAQLTEALRLKPDYPDAEKRLRELSGQPPD